VFVAAGNAKPGENRENQFNLDKQRRGLRQSRGLKHDPEKCVAVFRKDHAQTKG
jgi:hypothetical protein